MAAHLFLGNLAEIRSRAFAFFPAIEGVDHNEWQLRSATMTEIVVRNVRSSLDLTIARQWVGEVSSEAPLFIVGLLKELEVREGVAVPHQRRIIEMPRAVNDGLVTRTHAPAPVVAIRTEPHRDSPARRWLRGGLASGVIACIAAGVVLRDSPLGERYSFFPGYRSTRLTSLDDYNSVVAKLGRPAKEEWLTTPNGKPYLRLWYSRRGTSIVLVGEGDKARYAGALNDRGHVLHATAPALMNLLSR